MTPSPATRSPTRLPAGDARVQPPSVEQTRVDRPCLEDDGLEGDLPPAELLESERDRLAREAARRRRAEALIRARDKAHLYAARTRVRLQRWAQSVDDQLPGHARRGVDWGLWTLLLALLSLAYAGVHHPYWVRGGDSDFFISLARNIARGDGYTFNGNPVVMVPPGWPMMLAGAMKISPNFFYLKLLSVVSLLTFFAVIYRVCRRVATPNVAVGACLVTGISLECIEFSYLFFSDPPFAATAAISMLLALYIVEERGGKWMAPVWIVGLCVALTLSMWIRWTGLMLGPLVAAVMLHGRPGLRAMVPRLDRRWIAMGLSAVALVASFYVIRQSLHIEESVLEKTIDYRYDQSMARSYEVGGTSVGEMFTNLTSNGGRYLTGLIWELPSGSKLVGPWFRRLGWLLTGLCIVAAVVQVRRGNWLLMGAVLFWLPIAIKWPSAVPRYILPVAPLMLCGVVMGILPTLRGIDLAARRLVQVRRIPDRAREVVAGISDRWTYRWTPRIAGGLFLFALIPAIAVYAVEYLVAQDMGSKSNFYARYEGGVNRDLVSISHYLVYHVPPEDEIAVSGKRLINRSSATTNGWIRAVNAATGRSIQVVPNTLSEDPTQSPETTRWLRLRGVRWYLWQPRHHVVHHFRSGAIETYFFQGVSPFRARPDDLERMQWVLFEIPPDGSPARRVEFPAKRNWPRRVPLLDPTEGAPSRRGIWPGVDDSWSGDGSPSSPDTPGTAPPLGWDWAR